MLISEPMMLRRDAILEIIAKCAGQPEIGRELQPGIYQVGHFGSSADMPGYEHYPDNLSVGSYGVCDSVANLLAKCPELESSDRKFVVRMTQIKKATQSPAGGWRWHKWGEYIGEGEPTCEYLYDEPIIIAVYVYSIFEKV